MLRKNAKNVEKSRILHNFFEFERFDPFSKSVHNMTNHAPLRAVILRYESCDSELSIRGLKRVHIAHFTSISKFTNFGRFRVAHITGRLGNFIM